MTEQELSARIADINAQMAVAPQEERDKLKQERNKLEKEQDKLTTTKCTSAIIAKMKSLDKDTICLRDADSEENCFQAHSIWGEFAGGHYGAKRLRLDENDNLILVYNNASYFGNNVVLYSDDNYESAVTVEIAKKILIPNLEVILNDITDYYKLYRLPQDTSEMVDMQELFNGRDDLRSIDLRHFNTSHVTTMRRMFNECYDMQSVDLSTFDTSKVTDMAGMFAECRKLQSLDLSRIY